MQRVKTKHGKTLQVCFIRESMTGRDCWNKVKIKKNIYCKVTMDSKQKEILAIAICLLPINKDRCY